MSPQSAGNRRRYRFGEFLIDPASRELRRGRQLLAVSPKVFDCIAYLIDHKDRAVGRDELIAAVWGRADVADVQLRYLMRKIRRTLDDDGEGQKLIRTIPRFGFHWVAELADEEASQVSAAPLSAATQSIAPRGEPALPTASRPLQRIGPTIYRRFAPASPRARIVLKLSMALLFVAGFILSAYGLHLRQATGSNAAENARSGSPSHAIAVLPVAVDSIKDADYGDVITAGGVLAWADLGLRIVERFLGPTAMLETARYMNVDPPKREQRFYSSFDPRMKHGDDAILKAQLWISKQRDGAIGVAEIAKRVSLDSRTFLRRFVKATGLRPGEYQQRIRVSRARELLEFTRKNVDQIASAVGYSDVTGFRRVFRKFVGLTPSDYRKRFSRAEP